MDRNRIGHLKDSEKAQRNYEHGGIVEVLSRELPKVEKAFLRADMPPATCPPSTCWYDLAD